MACYPYVRREVLDRDGWRCYWCHRQLHSLCRRGDPNPRSRKTCDDCATVDHLVHQRDAPDLALDPRNMVACCAHCNLSRNVGDRPRPRTTERRPQGGHMASVGRR